MSADEVKAYQGIRVERNRVLLPPGVMLIVGDGPSGGFMGCVVDGLTRRGLELIRDTAIATINAAIQSAKE